MITTTLDSASEDLRDVEAKHCEGAMVTARGLLDCVDLIMRLRQWRDSIMSYRDPQLRKLIDQHCLPVVCFTCPYRLQREKLIYGNIMKAHCFAR